MYWHQFLVLFCFVFQCFMCSLAGSSWSLILVCSVFLFLILHCFPPSAQSLAQSRSRSYRRFLAPVPWWHGISHIHAWSQKLGWHTSWLGGCLYATCQTKFMGHSYRNNYSYAQHLSMDGQSPFQTLISYCEPGSFLAKSSVGGLSVSVTLQGPKNRQLLPVTEFKAK